MGNLQNSKGFVEGGTGKNSPGVRRLYRGMPRFQREGPKNRADPQLSFLCTLNTPFMHSVRCFGRTGRGPVPLLTPLGISRGMVFRGRRCSWRSRGVGRRHCLLLLRDIQCRHPFHLTKPRRLSAHAIPMDRSPTGSAPSRRATPPRRSNSGIATSAAWWGRPAPGVRYKFNEWASVGAAVEFPLTTEKDLEQYRFTLDLIFRY